MNWNEVYAGIKQKTPVGEPAVSIQADKIFISQDGTCVMRLDDFIEIAKGLTEQFQKYDG